MKVEIAHLPCIKPHYDYVAPCDGHVLVIKKQWIDYLTGINIGSMVTFIGEVFEGDTVSEVITSSSWGNDRVVLFMPFNLAFSIGNISPMFADEAIKFEPNLADDAVLE